MKADRAEAMIGAGGAISVRLAERYGLSTYDAMIAAAALHAGCDIFWSEDMQHGMALNGQLRISNL